MDTETFRAYLLVDETKEMHTVTEWMRTLRRMLKQGFQADAFLSTPDDAIREGKRVLMGLRGDSPNPYNHAQRVLNALARMQGFEDVHFKRLPDRRPIPRAYSRKEVRAILEYESKARGAKGREETLRRRALAWCSHFMAARRGEIHRLRVKHLDREHGFYTLEKPSKRGPPRTIPVEREFYSPKRPLVAWLTARTILETDPGVIWTNTKRTGAVPMRYAEIGQEMYEMSRALGFPVNFNRGRHTRATGLLRAGARLPYIQRVMGHAKIQTTAIYAEVDDEALRDELRKHRPPSPYTEDKTNDEDDDEGDLADDG